MVCTENLDSNVMVMKSTKDRVRFDASDVAGADHGVEKFALSHGFIRRAGCGFFRIFYLPPTWLHSGDVQLLHHLRDSLIPPASRCALALSNHPLKSENGLKANGLQRAQRRNPRQRHAHAARPAHYRWA
jgi:hypothetical protein